VAKAPPDLSGVLLKLERAETHMKVFADELATFSKRDPEPFGFKTEETTGQGESVTYNLYAIIREEPPRELALPFGDAIHNIRSALDHLVFELASPKGRKSRKLQFPIFTDECEFKVRNPPMLKSIKGDERTLIERVQPYIATNVPSDDPLAVLGRLSNRDKHRLLIPMVAALGETRSWVASDNADIRFTYLARGPVEDGAKIASFTATPKDPAEDMQVYPQSGLEIQVGDSGIIGYNIGASDLLGMLHYHVRFMIIEMWFRYGVMPPTWAELQASQ
jgi:hypothetical protein